MTETKSEPEQIGKLECIDIGANLTNKRFRNDLSQVIRNAQNAGVSAIVLTGSSESNSVAAAELCNQFPGLLYSTAGVHPHDARHFDESQTVQVLLDLYSQDQVVSVGECGLDFNRDFSPRDQQRHCFAAHLELAAQTGLPLFLHERDAFEPFCEMIGAQRDRIGRGVVHCFTGTTAQAKAYLDLDLYIGVTGWICDERRGQALRDAVQLVPANRLMIETDAPYLAPRDYRPKISRNEPKYLPHILNALASHRNESPELLAVQLLENTRKFFSLEQVAAFTTPGKNYGK